MTPFLTCISKAVEVGIMVSKCLLSSNQIYKTLVGSSINLECRVMNVGYFLRVWRLGDRVISVGNMMVRKGGRLSVSDGGDLEIRDIRLKDAGQYVCELDTE
jgi:hypothetical protein